MTSAARKGTSNRSHRAWFTTTGAPSESCASTPAGKCRMISSRCVRAVERASSPSRRSVVSTRVQIRLPAGCSGSSRVPRIENQRSPLEVVGNWCSTCTVPVRRTSSTDWQKSLKAASPRQIMRMLRPLSGSPSTEKYSSARRLPSSIVLSAEVTSSAAAALSSTAWCKRVSARRWLMSVCVPMTSETVPAGEGVAWPRISTQRHWPSAVRKRTSWLNGWYRAICCCNTASKVPRSSGCTNRRHAQNDRGLGCPW